MTTIKIRLDNKEVAFCCTCGKSERTYKLARSVLIGQKYGYESGLRIFPCAHCNKPYMDADNYNALMVLLDFTKDSSSSTHLVKCLAQLFNTKIVREHFGQEVEDRNFDWLL